MMLIIPNFIIISSQIAQKIPLSKNELEKKLSSSAMTLKGGYWEIAVAHQSRILDEIRFLLNYEPAEGDALEVFARRTIWEIHSWAYQCLILSWCTCHLMNTLLGNTRKVFKVFPVGDYHYFHFKWRRSLLSLEWYWVSWRCWSCHWMIILQKDQFKGFFTRIINKLSKCQRLKSCSNCFHTH